MSTAPDDRPSHSEGEHLARRTRIHARSLIGRVFLAPGRVFLVQETPDAQRLLACLEGLPRAPDDASPTPVALGFPAQAVVAVTRSGLALRGRSIQKWRTGVENERKRGRIRPAREEKLLGWLAEIEALSTQVAALHRLLASAAGPLTGSPYWLPADVEAGLTALVSAVVTGRVITPDVAWLVRLTAWVGGLTAARRLLATLRDGLVFAADHEARAALVRVRERAGRLAELLAQLDPLPLVNSEEDSAYESAQRRYDRERRESPLFDALRRAVAELPAEMTGPGGVVVPDRNREVDPARVIARCDAVLVRTPGASGWPELARTTALYLADGGSSALPWKFVPANLTGTAEYQGAATVRSLLEESREPGYDALLAALGDLEDSSPWQHLILRRLLLAGATIDDLRWALAWCRPALNRDGAGQNIGPVRAVAEWLAAHEAALDRDEIENLWDAAIAPGGRGGVESLVRYLEWLPVGTATTRLAAGVRGVVLLLSVPGSLRGPLRDRFRLWATPPRGTPLPADCPEELPSEVRALLRRLAYYQRATDQPERLPKSLRKPLDTAARLERERQFLRANLATLDEKQRARLRSLSARTATGTEDASGAARLLRQAREVCAVTALEAARTLFRRAVESWWQQRFHLAADLETFRWDDLGKLVFWMEALRPDDRARVERILAAFARHGPDYRAHLAENQPWLDRLRGAGRAPEAWLRPPAVQVSPEGGPAVTISASTDPREVFLMGSWFSTCLDVGHGVNRGAVIANAADANKAVVYAWSAQGRPIARKLVALTSDLRLLGYETYLVASPAPELEEAVDNYCAAWAARAGFVLANAGRPESLGGGFWYDDGVEPWSDSDRRVWEQVRAEAGPLPELGSSALEDPEEAAWVAAVRGDDPALLEAFLATAGRSDWRKSAAFWWVVKFPERASNRPAWWAAVAEDRWEILGHLEVSGRCTGSASFLFWETSCDADAGVLRPALELLWNVPPQAQTMREALAQVARIEGASSDQNDCFYCFGGPPPALSRLPVGEALRLLQTLHRAMHHTSSCTGRQWADSWAEVLRQTWLREQDAGPLVRAMRNGEAFLRTVMVELCRREFIPELVRELRRTLKRTTDPDEQVRMTEALAGWGSPHEQQRLSGSEPALLGAADPERIATDPRRPLGERVAATATRWAALSAEEDHLRNRLASEWADTFAEADRSALPESLRRELVLSVLRAYPCGFGRQQARTLFAWLRTLPADAQIPLWREESGVKALESLPSNDGPVLFRSLESADAGMAGVTRCCLIAAAEQSPALLLSLLDEAFVWLHPDAVEPLAVDVLAHVTDRAALRADPQGAKSYRLRALILALPPLSR